jgi:hypothetical protein
MNFYDLSYKLNLPVEELYALHRELFPNVKLYSYTYTLLKNEIEKLTKQVISYKESS